MKNRLTPQDLDARLKFVVGCVLAGVLTLTTVGVLYALVFVTQPIGAQAENDKMFFSVLSSVATFITGTLAGLMISTGRNSEDKNGNGIPDSEEQSINMPGCCPRVPAVNPFDPFARARRAKEKLANKLSLASENKMVDISQELGSDVEQKTSAE